MSLVTSTGTFYREAAAEFQKTFPGLTVDQTQFVSSQFAPRVLQERKGAVYSYDVIMTTYGSPVVDMVSGGVLDPIRPALLRPDVLDDKTWQDGFESNFPDREKKWGYSGFYTLFRAIWVNTDMVRPNEVRSVTDLLDPKWKGKIMGGDPRNAGTGWWPATVMRLRHGDDIIRRLYKVQEVVLARDSRQMTEFMVKNSYAIGVGAVNDKFIEEFRSNGVGKNLQYIPMDDADNRNGGSDIAYVFNRAPHPNAAKLFVNWVL
ncbi:MAG: extracellular solute-binding protein, partial [Chloroflexota bacterium]